uniref:Uncharacterized protein n=1 Tax=Anguilla anguilla TaxID=7936 RepID=A0A0E9UCB9_ANGAN
MRDSLATQVFAVCQLSLLLE